MNLYEITQTYTQAINMVDEDGIITPEWISLLEASELSLKEKWTNIAHIITEFEWKIELINKEIERLTNLKKSLDKNKEKLKDYIWNTIQSLWLSELDTWLNKFTFRKSERIIIEDESLLNDYLIEKITTSIDKTKLKSDIKSWKDIKWAKLETFNNLQIK